MNHLKSSPAPTARHALRLAALMALVPSAQLAAQTLTWDADAVTTGAQAGNGTWNTTNTNWWNGTTNVTWSSNTAVFTAANDTGSHTVSLGTSFSTNVTGLRFDNSGYTLQSDSATQRTITTPSAATFIINIAAGKTATFGSGFRVLTNSNNSSSLVIQGNGNANTTLTLESGSVLQTQNTSSGNMFIGFSAASAGNGSRANVDVKTGGTITFARALALNGNLTVNGGTVQKTSTGSGSPGLLLGGGINTGNVASNVTVNSGTVSVNEGGIIFGGGASTTTSLGGTLNINGGTVTTAGISRNTAGTVQNQVINLNGGTLRPATDNSTLIAGNLFDNATNGVFIGANGVTIDTNGLNTTLAAKLKSATGANGTFTKTGLGTLTLTGSSASVTTASPTANATGNTYTGQTVVEQGTLLVNNTAGSGTGSGAVTIETGAALGGVGSIAGNVTFDAGSKFVFNAAAPLTVQGTVSFGAFDITDLLNFDSSVAIGSYPLISGSSSISAANLLHVGSTNPYNLGADKLAYFNVGANNLEVVVAAIPEPSSFAALAGLGALGLVGLRRRRRVA